MSLQAGFLAEIEAFLKRSGWAPSRFSHVATGEGSFVTRLRGGMSCTLKTADRALAVIRTWQPSDPSPVSGPTGEAQRQTSAALAERREKIIAAFHAGDTLQVIGDRVGITRERVRQIVAKAGLEPRMIGLSENARARKERAIVARQARRDERQAKIDQIAQGISLGLSAAKAAEAVGVRRSTLSSFSKTGLINPPHDHVRWRWGASGRIPDSVWAEIDRLAEAKVSRAEISRLTGVHTGSIYRRFLGPRQSEAA